MKGPTTMRYIPFLALFAFLLLLTFAGCGSDFLPLKKEAGKPVPLSETQLGDSKSSSSSGDASVEEPALKTEVASKGEPSIGERDAANQAELELTKEDEKAPQAGDQSENDETPKEVSTEDVSEPSEPTVTKKEQYEYYANTKHDYDFLYPSQWIAKGNTSGEVVLLNTHVKDPFASGVPWVENLIKIRLTFEKFEGNGDFDEWFGELQENLHDTVEVDGKTLMLEIAGTESVAGGFTFRPVKPLGFVRIQMYAPMPDDATRKEAWDGFYKVAFSLNPSFIED